MVDVADTVRQLDEQYLRSLDDARRHLEQAVTAIIRANATIGVAAEYVPSLPEVGPDETVIPLFRAPADRWDGRTELGVDLAATARQLYDLLTVDGRRDP